MSRLELRPITLKEANKVIEQIHRHHPRERGCKFCIAAWAGERLVGVAIAGRPKARMLDDGRTAEVTRLATDGHPNACSLLYSACARSAAPQGHRLIVTYILKSESGDSLKAAGWTRRDDVDSEGGTWDRPSRRRSDKHPTEPKVRWEKVLAGR